MSHPVTLLGEDVCHVAEGDEEEGRVVEVVVGGTHGHRGHELGWGLSFPIPPVQWTVVGSVVGHEEQNHRRHVAQEVNAPWNLGK